MTEVERFFRRLVSTLAASDPGRLQGPIPLDDITGSILAYRANRRALQLDTVEDYESVLLRLCAGEGDLVRAEPEEARARFVQEAGSRNPDLTALYAFEDVRLTLLPEPLLWALAPDPRSDQRPVTASYEPELELEPEPGPLPESGPLPHPEPAPGDDAAEPEPEPVIVLGSAQFEVLPPERAHEPAEEDADPEEAAESGEDTVEEERRPICLYCGGSLPTRRTVNFCPHCGQSQTQILCPECRSEVEPGWRHCVNCGAAVGEA